MSESVKPEFKQCSRCHSTVTQNHFETNRKGELYKTCNNCRDRNRNDKDKAKQWRKTFYEKHKEEILDKQKAKRDELREKSFQEHPEKREAYQQYIAREQRFMELKRAYAENQPEP